MTNRKRPPVDYDVVTREVLDGASFISMSDKYERSVQTIRNNFLKTLRSRNEEAYDNRGTKDVKYFRENKGLFLTSDDKDVVLAPVDDVEVNLPPEPMPPAEPLTVTSETAQTIHPEPTPPPAPVVPSIAESSPPDYDSMPHLNVNTDIWDSVCVTDRTHTVPYERHGKVLTNVDAYYQIGRATELWGPYGKGWGLADIEWKPHTHPSGEESLVFSANLVVGEEIRLPVFVDVPFDRDRDSFKIAITQLIKKGLSYLGFSADVHMGMEDMPTEAQTEKSEQAELAIINAQTTDAVYGFLKLLEQRVTEGKITDSQYHEKVKLGQAKIRQLETENEPDGTNAQTPA